MKLGIDIGNSTLKLVLLNKINEIVYRENIFHRGNILENIEKSLNVISEKFGDIELTLGITGDNASIYSNLSKYIINEVPCIIEGVKFIYPHAQTIIDMGSQNAKFITGFKTREESLVFSTNTSCSAGTGSFLEEQASRLNLSLSEVSDLCKESKKSVNIAGRCSVFSKTDITHHYQEGTEIADILMGLCKAVVRNFKGNVIKKYEVYPKVALIGGLSSNFGIIKSFEEVLNLNEEDLIKDENGSIITSIGASLLGRTKKEIKLKEILELLKSEENSNEEKGNLKALKSFGINDSLGKHQVKISSEREGYLGIDIGSTSTNLVVTNDKGEVLSYKYLRTLGDPKAAVTKGLEEIKKDFNGEMVYKSIVTTGSGRYLIGKILEADEIINEITTQARAAIHIDNEVETIFEIGGQDSKFIGIEDGIVNDFEMNKICAAGTGSFIEEQSLKLGTPIEEFSDIAIEGCSPTDLGERCTVFMEGSIHKSISQNIKREDIYSGLCYSIVKNYLNGVVGNKKLGKKIFLQGGIAHNQGVLNAFRAVTGREIIVPPFFSVTGAYGASLYAREVFDKKSKEEVVSTPIKKEYKESTKNIFLEDYTDVIDPKKKTVGIPRVLFFHKLFPIFNKFFRSLGYNVILTNPTSKETIDKSRDNSTIEVCYPIKLVNGHVMELIEKKVDYIFLPNLHEVRHHNSTTRKDYSCTYMQSVGKMIGSNIDLEKYGIKLLNPSLTFKFGKTYVAKTLLEMCKSLDISTLKTINAIKNALLMYSKITNHLEDIGKKVMEDAASGEKIFVIMAREYDVQDPVLNMGISKKLEDMGYKVISVGNLEAFHCNLSKDYPNLYWPFGQHVLAGAKIVRNTPNLYAIHITNHGCGPDGILNHYFKQEMKGKPYLHIEVDEHSSAVGIITRLEAFIDSLNGYKSNEEVWKYESKTKEVGNKIYLPYSYPASELLKSQLESQGKEVVILDNNISSNLEEGKKFIRGKEYLSLTNLLGQTFRNISKDDQGLLLIFQNEGGEVDGQYSEFINRKLHENNYKTRVYSLYQEDMIDNPEIKNYFRIMILSDMIMNIRNGSKKKYIKLASQMIKENRLTDGDILSFATEVKNRLILKESKKNILVVGEMDIILNPSLNKSSLEDLEKEANIFYSPLSENLLYMWEAKREEMDKKDTEILEEYKELVKNLNLVLEETSPFSYEVENIEKESSKYFEHFNSGNGKYRLGKILDFNSKIDRIITVNSMYENTNLSLRHILENRLKSKLKPYINLEFDYSSNENTRSLLENFMYYL